MGLKIQDMRKVGARIRRLRRRKGLTQERLAEAAHYTPGYIGSIENARKTPSIEFLFDIAEALETSPAELLIDAGEGPDREAIKDQIKDLVDEL
ncbi:MAG TPA: helix-turn-helix transcriptional regulator [Acidobacteriota bacterium]|nr:helix-turn-helix transcriptional regulator [Acidobacteriota bacterium]